MSGGGNPYAVNGYAGSGGNATNPYAASGGGRYADPYVAQNNQSSASVNSYGSRERERRRPSNPYVAEQSPAPQSEGRRGGGYGGMGGPPQLPAQDFGGYGGYDGGRDRHPSQPRQQNYDQHDRTSTPERRPQMRGEERAYTDSRSRERRADLKPLEDRYQQPPPVPSAGGSTNGYGGTTTTTAAPRYKDYSPRRPAKSMDEIMRHIQNNWRVMEGDECIPVKVALQLMDPSSLGLADKEPDFADTHVDLQKSLKSVVNEHYADFNSAVGTYHKIQNAIRESQSRVRMLKGGLMNVKGGMLSTRPELRGLAETSGSLDDMVSMLSVIEGLKTVPTRLEERISEKKFLSAVDLLLESFRGLRKAELEEISALSDMRAYFANQESSLVDILVEELHDHLYLKSPYCADRWKKRNADGEVKEGDVAMMDKVANAWDRPVYHFLSNLDTTAPMEEDASKNPESDTFYYIHLILEALNKLGHLENAIQRIEQRMPVELYRVVDKTNNEIDARYPSHVRGQLNKDKRTALSLRINDGRSQVLSDFLWTLYSKFETVAEGHRVVHEVVAGIVSRDGVSKTDRYTGGFKELWKLYQMEMRSILHDYLAADGDRGARSGVTGAATTDLFSRPNRDKSKRMFKLAEMDQKALGIKSEEAELDEILKSSVPGLVSKSKAKGINSGSERSHDNTSAGHKLLIEPGVFNMTILLPPSLTFLQHLRDIVPQTSNIPMSTLTSFLDDFLLNVFHPQLEDAVTELCAHCMVDMEAFFEDPSWSKHSPHPIFKGTVAFMTLIRSFSDMLSSIPQDQMFTQLIINQLVTYYDKCLVFYKGIVSRVVSSPMNPNANTLTLKSAAAFAESGEIRDTGLELLKSGSKGSSPADLIAKEVQLLHSATKAAPISSYDIISDPKSVYQLSLLHNSMQWLSAALAQLRHVDSTSSKSHSRSTSKNLSVRRWTLVQHLKSPSSSHAAPLIFLPLNNETVIPFDTTLTSFKALAQTSLLTLHLDIRCGVVLQLSRVLRAPDMLNSPTTATASGTDTAFSPSLQRVDSSALPPLSSNAYPFVLAAPPSSASPLILQLNKDLIDFESNISSYLGNTERKFVLTGLPRLVDKVMVAGADNVLVMNANGAEKMRVDAMVVQQNLRGLLASVTPGSELKQSSATAKGLGISSDDTSQNEDDALLTSTQQYYTLFLSGPDEIINYIKDAKSSGRDVGYTYDELRTLIELCHSEKLRGDDREESVKARKRMGEVLLSLGEGMWDS